MRSIAMWGLLLSACWDGGGWPAPPRVLETSVDDGKPLAPTASVIAVLSADVELAAARDKVVLVRGEPPAELVAALAHPPLIARWLTQLVAVTVDVDGPVVTLTPRRALAPGARHTLVIGAGLHAGAGALPAAFERAFTTGSWQDGAPILELVDPPDGAAVVVRNLRAVHLRITRPIMPVAFDLLGSDGRIVPTAVSTDPCENCAALLLADVLAPRQHYVVRATGDAIDDEGQHVFGNPPGFDAGDLVRDGPVALAGLDVIASDGCVVARFTADAPTEAQLCAGAVCTSDARRLGHELAVVTDADHWRLAAWDESTRPAAQLDGAAAQSLVGLAITEIQTDPLGTRLGQQFVELFNTGSDPVELGGLTLHDPSGADLLPAATLLRGGFALVVPHQFVVDDGVDAPPAAGTLIVRIAAGELGGNGLRVSGEPVWLADAAGRVVSRWGGWAAPRPRGQSVSRRRYDACDRTESFTPTIGGTSPGAP